MAEDHLVADDAAIRATDALFSTPSNVGQDQHQQNHVSQSSNHHATDDDEARRAQEAAAFAANATVDQQQPPFASEQQQEAVADTPMADAAEMSAAVDITASSSVDAEASGSVKHEEVTPAVAFANSSMSDAAASPTADTEASASSGGVAAASAIPDDVSAAVASASLIDATAMDDSDDEDMELVSTVSITIRPLCCGKKLSFCPNGGFAWCWLAVFSSHHMRRPTQTFVLLPACFFSVFRIVNFSVDCSATDTRSSTTQCPHRLCRHTCHRICTCL